MSRLIRYMIAVAMLWLCACDTLDDDRIVGSCRIDLGLTGTWSVYGVHAVGEYRMFVRERHLPSNFPYTATTYTGNGGVLLIGVSGSGVGGIQPVAYEMACPYCRRHSTLIEMDDANLQAVCYTCQSRYDVLIGGGQPVSGPALDKHYALHSYRVSPSVNGGYMITN